MLLFGSLITLILCLAEKVFFSDGQTTNDSSDFDDFKTRYNKNYANPAEEETRRQIYLDNKKLIDEYNALHDRGLLSYSLKMNNFGDLQLEEFVSAVNGYYGSGSGDGDPNGDLATVPREPASHFVSPAHVTLPQSVDWRTLGAVTPVKDQRQCGACWAFSALGALEGQHWRKTGELLPLSVQQLMDCSSDYGNEGCEGGDMVDAFQYIKENGGVMEEDDYPYEAEEGDCRHEEDLSRANISGFVRLTSGDESELKAAVATVGPVSIAFDASNNAFQFYDTGIYYEPECSSTLLDHGVLVVGYGSEGGVDYWIVKNSWGTNWGEQGYFRVRRNFNNHCGVATDASYPLV